jgi:integrase/recombinase XerD
VKGNHPTTFALALRAFFSEHMPLTRGLSPHTVLSYRDALVLLLRFLATRHQCAVVELDLGQLTPPDLIAYLEHLEIDRGNGAATRNARLAAVHSFVRFVATRHPEHLEMCQRLLAVPSKRARTRTVEYLDGHEIHAMLDAIDCGAADGQRDYALLLALFNTGARVQEILDVTPVDLQLQRPFQLRLRGKGRKERICPLWPRTVDVLSKLLGAIALHETSTERVFRNHRGQPLTRFGVRYLLQKYARLGIAAAPTLAKRRVHPHVIRHSAATHLLQAGVDLVSISHWLGHASVETTNRYATVDLETKRAAVANADPLIEDSQQVRAWRSDNTILKWLESL